MGWDRKYQTAEEYCAMQNKLIEEEKKREEEARKYYEFTHTDGHGLKAGDIIRCNDGVVYQIHSVDCSVIDKQVIYHRYIEGKSKYRIDKTFFPEELSKLQQRRIKWITQEEYNEIISNNFYNDNFGYRWRIFDVAGNEVPYNKESYELALYDEKVSKGEIVPEKLDPRINTDTYMHWCCFLRSPLIVILFIISVIITIFITGGFTVWIAYIAYIVYGIRMNKKVNDWYYLSMKLNKENYIRNKK